MSRWFYLLLLLIAQSAALAQPDAAGRGVKVGESVTAVAGGSTYAIVVGISRYKDVPSLQFADQDALAFVQLLQAQGIPARNIRVFLNEQATETAVYDEFTRLKAEAAPGDRVYFYFAGHGDIESTEATDTPLLLLHRALPKNYTLGTDFIKFADLKAWMDALVINKTEVMLILDACHSGAFTYYNAQRTGLALKQEWQGQLKMTSCGPTELALEGEQWGNGRGLFSYHLIDGLMGLADADKDGKIRKDELEEYLRQTVRRQAEPNSQTPQLVGYEKKIVARSLPPDSIRHWRERRQVGTPTLVAVNSTGRVANLLSETDSATQRTYRLFEKALANNRLLRPATDCALYYFRQIPGNDDSDLNDEIRRWMKRSLAAKLQDKAMALLEPLTKDLNTSQFLSPDNATAQRRATDCAEAISELDTAMRLLGTTHYLNGNLRARRLYLHYLRFDASRHDLLNGQTAAQMLDTLAQSYRLEPTVPYTTLSLAMLHLVMFRQDSARYYAQKTLALLPNSLAATFLLGLIQEEFTNVGQANSRNPYFEQVYQRDQSNPLVHQFMAKRHLQQPDKLRFHTREAERHYRRLYNVPGSEALLFSRLSSLYRQIGELDKAIQYARQTIQADSVAVDGYEDLGVALFDANQYAEAITSFQQALRRNPNSIVPIIHLALIYANRESLDTARTYFEQYRRFNPDGSTTRVLSAVIGMKTEQWMLVRSEAKQLIAIDPAWWMGYWLYGMAENLSGDKKLAITYLKKADSLSVDNLVQLPQLGNAYFDVGDFEAGERCFQRLIQLNPTQKEAYVKQIAEKYTNLGIKTSLTNDYLKAIALFQKASSFVPNEARNYREIGDIWRLYLRKPTDALPYLEKANRLDSTDTANQLALAKGYQALQQREKASRLYQKMLARDSTNADANTGMSDLLDDQHKPAEAIPYAKKALLYARPDQRASRYFTLVTLHFQLGNADSLILYATKGIALVDSLQTGTDKSKVRNDYRTTMRYMMLVFMGAAYSDKGDLTKAKSILNEVLTNIDQLDSLYQVFVYRMLSRINRRQKQYEQARRFAENMKALAPNDPVTYQSLCMLAAVQGNTQEALHYLEISLQKGMDDPYFLEQEEELADLRIRPEFAALVQRYKISNKPKSLIDK